MNRTEIKGNWKQMIGKVKEKWGKLTDDDLTEIDGKYDQLVGHVQQRYGKARAEAENEVREFVEKCEREPANDAARAKGGATQRQTR